MTTKTVSHISHKGWNDGYEIILLCYIQSLHSLWLSKELTNHILPSQTRPPLALSSHTHAHTHIRCPLVIPNRMGVVHPRVLPTHTLADTLTHSLTTLTSDSLSGNWWTSWTKLYNGLFCGFKQWNLNKAPSNVVFVPICISSGRPPPTIKNLWPLRTKGNPQMRRNSRLHYAYLNCSVLPCGQIIDAFCLDVTKCGERLCNETNIENAPLRLVQHRCLDWQKAWTEISSGGKKNWWTVTNKLQENQKQK